MAYLALIRHGYSFYNIKGLWTGWMDPELTPEGKKEAEKAAFSLKDIHFSIGYTSPQIRHKETLGIVKDVLGLNTMSTVVSPQLKERNYGVYTGKNKWEVERQLGKEAFKKLRRGWNYPVPGGESLKDVYKRVVNYYQKEILPKLKNNENVIVSSSGNAIRSLVKFMERIPDNKIADLEIAPGEAYLYELDSNGNVLKKEIRNAHPNTV
ncbi:MAG: histidine phosphatase family protein [Patescibacteria group bacterium]|nr:histidine phosphatase family protein [Patescibacteria group bacterium]